MTEKWRELLSPEDERLLTFPMKDEDFLGASPVLITMHVSGQNAKEESVLQTRGLLSIHKNCWSLSFYEMLPASSFTFYTYMKWEEESLLVMRIGDAVSSIIYKKDEMYESSSETAEGLVLVRIFTYHAAAKRRGRNGEVEIGYRIERYQEPYATPGMAEMCRLQVAFCACQ